LLAAFSEQFRVGGVLRQGAPHPKCLAAVAASAFRPPHKGEVIECEIALLRVGADFSAVGNL